VRLGDWIDEMRVHIEVNDWKGLEDKYLHICSQLAGDELAAWIRYLDFGPYLSRLGRAYRKALRHVRAAEPKAIYFEYDMLNDWRGSFFLCPEYLPESARDDDWACEWEARVDGPDFAKLSEVLLIDGGKIDQDPPARGKSACLIARTLATLGRCMDEHPVVGLSICAAYHGQDPVSRLYEPAQTLR
jgi:hypothetical protein